MESLKELYKIGTGPSSSHTMGPKKAAEAFVKRASDADRYKVTLYGSLAATGKGHMTDVAILSVLEPVAPTEIVWRPDISLPFHPNGMRFEAFKAEKPVDEWVIYSVGGGALANEETAKNPPANIYPMTHISEILEWCNREGQTFWEYVEECEGPGIWDYLDEIWTAMCETIVRGLTAEGVLPGGLKVSRKASTYLVKAESYTDSLRSRAKLYAYALATAEENASGGTVVTAPTCGSSAVMPAVLYHLVNTRNFSRLRILRALATGGLFGNVAKTNSSISGAEVGCQGEVGVACAMAAAAACQLFGGTPSQIEYAAEMGLEHHLGLTCEWVIYSVGGGALANEETAKNPPANIYPMTHISEILEWCNREGQTFWEYVEECEGPGIWDYLDEIWTAMCETIVRGLTAEGVLPGGLKVSRKASTYLVKAESYTDSLRSRAKLYAYALATAEENASGGTVVTAPTCGSSAVMPAVLYHLVNTRNFSRLRILRALATGGLFGNVAKTNSSISGAEVGCQGEVGVACAMAAAAACQLFGGTPSQIEYAAEMGLEHHLGLTCDPVCGLVQIPCIERNAVAAARALDANSYANLSDGHHMISYDRVVEVMKETGKDIPSLYRETSEGGLARNYTQK